MKREKTLRITCAALCLSLALVLPFLTGQIPRIGNMLAPMHIPVFLCGFLCGWGWGAAVGLLAPPLRSVLFGAPVFFPMAVSMAAELCVYGFVSGFLYRRLKKGLIQTYISLLTAMVAGRLVWGGVRLLCAGLTGGAFPFSAFLAGAVTRAIPGIILQLVLVPPLVGALEKVMGRGK